MTDAVPARLEFQTRSLMTDDSGAAFQEFAWEALSITEFKMGHLLQHPVKGQDGGIDLVFEASDRRVVLECKYHDESRADPPQADWTKVLAKLRENLPALCDRPVEARSGSPYAPWLATDRPITEYWFCTSATLPHENALDNFRAQIVRGLTEISRLRAGLAHLAKVRVEIRAGQHFLGVATRNAPLRYRWFGGFPKGLAPIAMYTLHSRKFRTFLATERLPYFSVEAYARERDKVAQPSKIGPAHLLRRLLDDGDRALVISGPGGVGKTRLGLEIARAAEAAGIIVLTCTTEADEGSIERLAKASLTGSRAILFVDYAENQRQLASLASAIGTAASMGHDIRIVATCRSSAANEVLRAFDDISATHVRLSSEHKDQSSDYLGWVADKILTHGGLETIQGLRQICSHRPVLAAFALHLKESGPERFERLFSGLASDETFEAWARRRIESLIGTAPAPSTALRDMAVAAACMPLSAGNLGLLKKSGSQMEVLIESLLNDGWLDEDEVGGLIASHDVFADSLIGAYLFEAGRDPNYRTRDLMRHALTLDTLAGCVSNIDRLAAHPDFHLIDGPALFGKLAGERADIWAAAHEAIALSALVPARELVALCERIPELEKAIVANPALTGRLAHVAREFVGETTADQEHREGLTRLLRKALDQVDQRTNLLLRRAFEVDPKAFSATILESIRAQPTSFETHFLIVTWLKAGLDPQSVMPQMQRWLHLHCPQREQCSFVISAWLQNGGALDDLKGADREWLTVHAAEKTAIYVMLPLARSMLLDKQWIFQWLDSNGSEAAASRLLAICRPETFPVCEDGSREALATYASQWLDSESHAVHLNASHVFSMWLDNGFPFDRVRKLMANWLEVHAGEPAAANVLRWWLNQTRRPDDVETLVVAWLEMHYQTDVADILISEWLDQGGSYQSIELRTKGWLAFHLEDERSVYTVKQLARIRDLDMEMVALIVAWCSLHRTNPDTITRINRILARYGRGKWREPIANVAVDVLEHIDPHDLAEDWPGRMAVLNVLSLVAKGDTDWRIGSLRWRVQSSHQHLALGGHLYKDLGESGEPPFVRSSMLVHLFAELIALGHLSLEQDRSLIETFTSWVRSWKDGAVILPVIDRAIAAAAKASKPASV